MLRSLLLAASCAAAVLLSTPCVSAGPHWTQFRRRATNNAVVRGALRARWKLRVDGRISASPTFSNGILYVGTNAGTLYAIRARDGTVRWKQHAPNALMSAPLLYHGLVILGEGNAGDPYPTATTVGTGESALVAFNQHTGKLRWKTMLRGSGMPTPAIVDGVLVHHDGSGRITGMNPLTGRLLYERNLHSIASMTAALPLGGTYFATAGVLHNAVWEIDARSGRIRWRSAPFPEGATGIGDSPLATDGRSIFGEYVAPDRDRGVPKIGQIVREHAYALDARTGALLWDRPLEKGPLPIRNEAGIPVVHDGVLYVGGAAAPWMHAIDVRTGRLLWTARINGPVKGAIAVKNGIVYFGDLGGYLWALSAHTGTRIGVMPLNTSFNVGSPIIVGKTLFIGSLTDAVYAMPLRAIRTSSL